MRRDGRSGLTEGRNEYILPNYSTFGIMNTVGNLFHQIEEISVAPRTVLMIYQLTAISWLSTGLTMEKHNVYFDIQPACLATRGATWKVKTNARPEGVL